MRAGKFRKIVSIEQPSRVADAVGEMVPTWTPFATNIYAEIEPLRGTEKLQAMQINASATDAVTIRYLPGVTPQMRITYGTRVLQIQNVQNTKERDREIVLLCTELQ
jgi:SPP1 family predicted phage head-tail adaptor